MTLRLSIFVIGVLLGGFVAGGTADAQVREAVVMVESRRAHVTAVRVRRLMGECGVQAMSAAAAPAAPLVAVAVVFAGGNTPTRFRLTSTDGRSQRIVATTPRRAGAGWVARYACQLVARVTEETAARVARQQAEEQAQQQAAARQGRARSRDVLDPWAQGPLVANAATVADPWAGERRVRRNRYHSEVLDPWSRGDARFRRELIDPWAH